MNGIQAKRTHPSNKKPVSFNQRLSFWIAILFLVLVIAGYRHYNSFIRLYAGSPPLPVVLATAEAKDVPVYLDALGNVTPTYTVTVRTQINGQLMRVLFKEGQNIKQGDLLAEIDDRPYLAQLMEFTGQLERDKAQLANAIIDLHRYQTLWKQDSISQQTLATQQALVNQLEGTIKLDQGLIETTKVNLIYTKITSPIDGRIGLRLVDPGNFVQTTDTTGIAVINTVNPITVIFTLPEDSIPAVIHAIQNNKQLPVEALDRQQNKHLANGTLLTIDNQIDTTTGMVRLRSEFENKDNILFPNQFVNMRLLVDTLKQATVIPTAAIQHSSKENYVYVLNDNHTVSAKQVTEGTTINDQTTIISGVLTGQRVVIEGADKLRDGVKVIETTTA